nr:hypothetical protein KUHPSE03_p1490 [Staphylococcus epidermidis]
MINLLNRKTKKKMYNATLVFSIGVFLILIIPIATNLVPLIPECGDKVRKALKYIPFNFLVDNV